MGADEEGVVVGVGGGGGVGGVDGEGAGGEGEDGGLGGGGRRRWGGGWERHCWVVGWEHGVGRFGGKSEWVGCSGWDCGWDRVDASWVDRVWTGEMLDVGWRR